MSEIEGLPEPSVEMVHGWKLTPHYDEMMERIVRATKQLDRELPRTPDSLWERLYWRAFGVWPTRTATRHAIESVERYARYKQLLHDEGLG